MGPLLFSRVDRTTSSMEWASGLLYRMVKPSESLAIRELAYPWSRTAKVYCCPSQEKAHNASWSSLTGAEIITPHLALPPPWKECARENRAGEMCIFQFSTNIFSPGVAGSSPYLSVCSLNKRIFLPAVITYHKEIVINRENVYF